MAAKHDKPNIVFDFDGVIHSYKSGWKGAENIPDPVVPGIADAIRELREIGYRVVVVSTRCSTPKGMDAVRRYLDKNEIVVDDVLMEKPPALCYIDDRAIRFDGHPEKLVEQVVNFRTWLEGCARKDDPVKSLRRCEASLYENGKKKTVIGRFHQWGVSFEEFDNGAANFTTAIVELEDGRVVSCMAEMIRFCDR